MKKITSFLMMLLFCCTSVFAQVATEYVDKYITIGTAQEEMVPGQWYFLHNPRNPNSPAEAFAEVGGTVSSAGGFVTDMGLGSHVKQTAVLDEDLYQEAVYALIDDYTTIVSFSDGAFIDNLLEGVNVGTNPGNYRQEDVDAFLAIHRTVEELLFTLELEGFEALQQQYPTAEDIEKLREEYMNAYNHINENKVSLALTSIAPGYYTINSAMYWYTTKNDTVFYSWEEADSINESCGYVEGDEGYVTPYTVKEVTSTRVPATIKSLFSAPAQGNDGEMGDWLAWGPQQPQAEYLWKIEAVEGKPTEYRMTNVANGKTHVNIEHSGSNSRLALNDTATVCFDWRNDNETVRYTDAEGREVEKKVVSFNIRSSSQPENNYYYLHCGSHSNGASTGPSWVVGWSDLISTRWYMTPVDEATVDEWTNGPESQIRAKVQKGDSIAAAFPDQLEIAKDLFANMDTSRNVANINTFSSPYHCPAEGSMEQLFDGIYNSANNFWHSNWQSGNDYAYSTTNGTNYFVVEDADATINGGLAVMVARRPITNDHLTQLTVYGTNDTYSPEEDLTNIKEGGEELYTWTELGVLKTPYGNGAEFISSNAIAFEGQYRFYKFVATGTTNSRGYFHMGEFALYPAKTSKRYETTQYDARKTEADALAEAVAVWNERGYTEDNTELLADEEFLQAYDNIVAAGEAWGKVFVDPTPLREAIAAAPAENTFVFGNNPGQWKEGTATPAAIVAAAEAYNASGVYTPAESEAHIAALANAEADIFASVNKVETGKWYRFKFATEEMFENYGWDKNGSKAAINSAGIETAPSLWGKTVAVGKSVTSYLPYETEEGEADTATVRTVEVTDDWYEGDNLCFFENVEFTNGEDLFRFIQATDTSYMIQNKATGLFIQAGHPVKLSAIPSYFTVEAIGAGATLIGYTDVMGNADNHRYLHGERPSGLLTKWYANTLGSNSMMFIEEAENVTDEPSTEYRTKLWPGQVYTYTYPVDVTISDGATAYAAGLTVNEGSATVTLQAVENGFIQAGTPFVMIAAQNGEYISMSERLEQIASEILAENGQYGKNEKKLANIRLNDEYAIVNMVHGMSVSTNSIGQYSLRGTLQATTVNAGKAILPFENGFKHTLTNKSVSAYTAWVVSDFNPNSEDILGEVHVKFGDIKDSLEVPEEINPEDVPMSQWNFTEDYNAGNGLYYRLDVRHRLACVRLGLNGEFQSLAKIDVPESFIFNNKTYYVVAMEPDYAHDATSMLQTLGLPASLKYIYGGSLGRVRNLKNINIAATSAPAMDEWQDIEFNRLKVTIPDGSLNSYSLDPMWSSALLVQQTPVEISLALSAPGELRYQIMEHVENLKEVNKLAITSGTLNATDWNALSAMTNLMELDIEACGNAYIPESQFRGSRLETVKLPAGLTQIKYATFSESRRLASVTIPEGVTLIDGGAFQLCSSLKDVVLNEGLTEIGFSAFHMCDITSLTMPSTLKRINNDAFAYNYRLKELNLNEGLESIMHNAFYECDSLKEVVLPSTLTICYIPFAYCDNLTSLTSNALIPAGTDNNCPVSGSNMANVVLKVPAWSLDEYKFAPGWSEIPQIVASDYQPENIVISKDFTLRIKESEVDANYRPNVALKWSNVWSYDNQENGYYERGNLTVAQGAMLNANSFSMFYSPLGQYYDNPNNWDGQREYNTNSLLVEGSMRADDVTITLMNRNSAWQFISFPFDVRMSDMVPVDPNTYWVVREYSGAERANGNMEETWTDLDADDVLKAGKGYIMHCYSEEGEPVMFQVKADMTSMTRQNIFISSDNEVMLEEHIAEFEHNSSWNLVGNPYPCYYDIRCTDFSAPVTVWDSYYQNYVAKSPLDDDYVLYPGEAFFVQRPVEQESIVFYAEGRQTDRYAREMTNARKSATTDRKVYNIVLKGEKTADRTRVVLNEKASMAYEMNCDASKFDAMSRDASQIFTVAGNARMAINERPMGSGIVELGVVIASEGVYTIALKQAGEKKVVLEDRKLGVCTVLSADNEYTFSAVPGEAKGRFFLNFDESATGIDGIGAGQTNKEPAYNTTGVRVEDGQKGLVIKEGKKIVNK